MTIINKLSFIHVAVFYCLAAALLYPIFEHYLCVDGYMYINCAKHYVAGNLDSAMDAYWSPLIIWLLTPLLWIGLPSLLGYRMLLLFIGFLVVVFSNGLIKKIKIEDKYRYILLIIISIVSLSHALEYTTPDLLFVATSLLLANILTNDDYISNKYSGIICGVIGAFVYFAKAFGFLYFIACFLLVNFILGAKNKNKNKRLALVKHTAFGMIFFMMVSAIWIVPISYESGNFTITKAGMKHTVYEVWGSTDKSEQYRISDTWENKSIIFKRQFNRFKGNVPKIGLYLGVFSVLSFFILIGAFYHWKKKKEDEDATRMLLLLLMVLVLLSGYSLLFINRRYLLLSQYLLLILGAKLLLVYIKDINVSQVGKRILTIMFAFSFLISPLRDFYFYNSLKQKRDQVIAEHNLSALPIDGKISSYGRHDRSMSLCFANGWDFVFSGGLKNAKNKESIRALYKERGVQYIVVWQPEKEKRNPFVEFEEMGKGEIKEYGIYKIY